MYIKWPAWRRFAPSECSSIKLSYYVADVDNMDVLTGFLVDVSGSMKQNVSDNWPRSVDGNQRVGSWAKSIFKFIDRLITRDASPNHLVFVVGFGSSSQHVTFDVLTTLEAVQAMVTGDKQTMLREAVMIVETHGAPRTQKWATIDEIAGAVGEREVAVLLNALKNQPDFRDDFISDCLPLSCKIFNPFSPAEYLNLGSRWAMRSNLGDPLSGRREKSIEEVVTEGMELVKNYIVTEVTDKAVHGVKDASQILRGSIGEKELTDRRADELLKSIEPYIYGGTPLIKSLIDAKKLFRAHIDHQHKLLFVLSDGEPADGNDPPLRELDRLSVTVVCCYITRDHIAEPRRLYSRCNPDWEVGAKFMFHMSSSIPTQKIPRTVFVKKDWKIDIDNNETRLFFQINHPDLMEEVCKTAKECVLSQDSLSDVLSSISLDIYINDANEGFLPEHQPPGKTCYAHAAATVIHLAMKRIVGREGGCPEFHEIRDKLVKRYGVASAKVGEVLRDVCPEYRLRCQKTKDTDDALSAVVEKRPLVATFQLSVAEWRASYTFYKRTPRGILTSNDIMDMSGRVEGIERRGHAVVLTSFNYESLRLMNSKGSDWADGGFFRVQNAAVLGLQFYDIFWTEEDLLPSEKEAYDRYGADISAKLMKSLRSLQTATYRCPLCSVRSNVSEFSGHLLQAQCPNPKCRGTFNANHAESDLALNIYLTSLLSSDTAAAAAW